jgi:hypothetical protein
MPGEIHVEIRVEMTGNRRRGSQKGPDRTASPLVREGESLGATFNVIRVSPPAKRRDKLTQETSVGSVSRGCGGIV